MDTGAKREREGDSENDDVSAAKRITYDFNDMITILVGEEEHRFTAHKDMLCAKSKFFKAACSKVWASGREKIVRQPDSAPEDFQMYVEWVYTSKISLDTDDLDKQQSRDATMKRLIANTRKGIKNFPREQLLKVYAATIAGSPLRQFIVNWALTTFDHDNIKSYIAHEPAEFVEELAVAAVEQVTHMDADEAFEFLTVMRAPGTNSD